MTYFKTIYLNVETTFRFMLHIPEQVAMFAACRSQKSLRKQKDPITGNSFVEIKFSGNDSDSLY